MSLIKIPNNGLRERLAENSLAMLPRAFPDHCEPFISATSFDCRLHSMSGFRYAVPSRRVTFYFAEEPERGCGWRGPNARSSLTT